MKANLIRIGNSKGIRIPKGIIEQCGFADHVELQVEGDRLIVMPARVAREGWDVAFETMAEQEDDALLLPQDLEHSFDEEEWKW